MRSVFLDYSTVSVGDLDPQALQAAAPNLVLREATRQADVADAIAGCEIVLLNKLRMTREIIAGSNSLKLIALAATGTNNIDLEAARDHGVAVCNIRDYCTPSVTQHVLGVLLALTHRLADYSRDATDGTWASSPHFTILRHPIRELGGRTLGVVGAKRGRMADILEQVIVVNDTHYGRVEDAQMGVLHMLCYAFMEVPETTR